MYKSRGAPWDMKWALSSEEMFSQLWENVPSVVSKCSLSYEKMFPQLWVNVPSVIRKCSLSFEEMFPQLWGNVSSVMRKCSLLGRKCSLNYEEMFPQLWGNVLSVMRKCSLSYKEMFPQLWGNVPSVIRKCSLSYEEMFLCKPLPFTKKFWRRMFFHGSRRSLRNQIASSNRTEHWHTRWRLCRTGWRPTRAFIAKTFGSHTHQIKTPLFQFPDAQATPQQHRWA